MDKKKLKTVEEHNNTQYASYKDNNNNINKKIKLGVQCSKCEKELFKYNNGIELMSSPPKIIAYCECGFQTYLIA